MRCSQLTSDGQSQERKRQILVVTWWHHCCQNNTVCHQSVNTQDRKTTWSHGTVITQHTTITTRQWQNQEFIPENNCFQKIPEKGAASVQFFKVLLLVHKALTSVTIYAFLIGNPTATCKTHHPTFWRHIGRDQLALDASLLCYTPSLDNFLFGMWLFFTWRELHHWPAVVRHTQFLGDSSCHTKFIFLVWWIPLREYSKRSNTKTGSKRHTNAKDYTSKAEKKKQNATAVSFKNKIFKG